MFAYVERLRPAQVTSRGLYPILVHHVYFSALYFYPLGSAWLDQTITKCLNFQFRKHLYYESCHFRLTLIGFTLIRLTLNEGDNKIVGEPTYTSANSPYPSSFDYLSY